MFSNYESTHIESIRKELNPLNFELYEPIESIEMLRNFKTNQVWGFSFVYMTESANEAAIAERDGSKWMDHRLQISKGGFAN